MFSQAHHLKIYASFNEAKEEWLKILPNHHHLLSNDLLALENTKAEHLTFSYVTVFNQNMPIGVMYLQHLNFNQKHFSHSFLDKPFLKILKPLILKLSTNILVCGNLFRVNFQGFYFTKKEDRAYIFDCLKLYKQQVKKTVKFSGILVKDCSRTFKLEDFSCNAFMPYTEDLTMEIDINPIWQNFNDYVNALSRKYKQRANKIIKAIEPIEKKNLTLEDVLFYKDKIEQLYLDITQKQNIALGILNANYFIEMKRLLDNKFEVIGYFENNELIAYSCHIFYPEKKEMETHYIGFDNEKNKIYNLYFNIIFHGIETAINKGYKKLELGRTAREAKASAGAYAVENYNYIWIKQGIARLAVKYLSKSFTSTMGDEWKNRNPFK